jgi:nitrogenase molybdenum-iron protein alpha/beta subunit
VTGTTGPPPLHDFEIPLYNQRRLFGIFLAAHAIPDAVNVMHTGVGCKPKAQRQIAMHDRGREAQNKMVWSDISEAHLIRGSAEALRNITLETIQRREEINLVLITASTAMELTGLDLSEVAGQLEAKAGCPVIYLRAAGTEGDHYDGYADVLSVVLARCRWDAPVTEPAQVNLIGYPFDRYELDHQANLREIHRLLSGLGATGGEVLLSGTPLSDLKRAPDSGANLVLPWASALEDGVLQNLHRPYQRVVPPLSGRGTRLFLEQVAGLLDLPRRRVEALVRREQRKVAPMLRTARELMAGRRVAILADTPFAVGLTAAAVELHLRPALVGLLDQSLGGAAAFFRGLERLEVSLPAGCTVLPAPTASEVDAAATSIREAHGGAGVEVVVSPDLWLPPSLTEGAARLEMGLPANRKHGLYAMPAMGFNGLVALAQRVLDAVHRVH